MTPAHVLEAASRDPELGVYVIGPLDKGVTVLAQQTRALNLAWALVESGAIAKAAPAAPPCEIAVVGAGFAGLTFAAAILRKSDSVRVTLLEQRDNVLPLQQGSDSRWLHPRIYDWPAQGSTSPSAALPVLNWSASRASDVVVQVLRGWEHLIAADGGRAERVSVVCNAQHVRLLRSGSSATLEWMGERRDPARPAHRLGGAPDSLGQTQAFDHVVLALGFGLEPDEAHSYWRNETLGQPDLSGVPRTYAIAGAGDGAVVDLLRLRVAEFRQDRILRELFPQPSPLVERLEALRAEYVANPAAIYDELEALHHDPALGGMDAALAILRQRLRRDTRVVLRVRRESFAEVLGSGRLSFQNALLLYLLFKCGGFDLATLVSDSPGRGRTSGMTTISRIGPDVIAPYRNTLPADMLPALRADLAAAKTNSEPSQTSAQLWPGGYFDYPGTEAQSAGLADEVKASWRKEYLPTYTRILAESFCATVAGYLGRGQTQRLRVTLHRALPLGRDRLLQQTCGYRGVQLGDLQGSETAGRTFDAGAGTIGEAMAAAAIVRTRSGASSAQVQADMKARSLNETSREMSQRVRFVMAMPLLGPGSEVIAVLYIDSEDETFQLDNDGIDHVRALAQAFLDCLDGLHDDPPQGVSNFPFPDETRRGVAPVEVVLRALEHVPVPPPMAKLVTHLNFDADDFVRSPQG